MLGSPEKSYMYIHVMHSIMVVGNGIGNQSSNSGEGCLFVPFTLMPEPFCSFHSDGKVVGQTGFFSLG